MTFKKNIIDRFLDTGWKARRAMTAGLVVVTALIVIGGALSFLRAEQDALERVLADRETAARLTAAVLEERLNRVTDIGVSLASRVRFRQLIAEGRWEEAVLILSSVPQDFGFIERVFLADSEGVLRADFPMLPGVIGQSFAFRDWYKGVSREWKPYISEAYKRSAAPQIDVVAAATPIFSDTGKVLGILVMQIPVRNVFDWTDEIGESDHIVTFFVDRNGRPIGLPPHLAKKSLTDFTALPGVREVISGRAGSMIAVDPEEREDEVIAYAPVRGYGWGIIVEESTRFALEDRRRGFREELIVQLFLSALFMLSLAFMTALFRRMTLFRQRELAFLNSTGDGLFAIDKAWNIILWNPAAERISGWTAKEALGRPMREIVKFIRERDREENVLFIAEAMLKKKPMAMENNTVLIRKDGTEVPVGDSAAPLIDEGGKVIGAIIVFRDVREEREAQHIRSEVAYASHQLRTPVTKLLWHLQVAIEQEDRPEIRDLINVAHLSAQSVAKLTDQLLMVSEIDQNRVIPETEQVKLIELIEGAVGKLKPKAEKLGVTLDVAPVSTVAGIDTSAKLVERALYEVLDNALIYNRPGGRVEMKVVEKPDAMLFEIRDTGIGVREAEANLVFTKFYRGNNFETTKIIGGGLGLYISRAYVRQLGGDIWFKSKEGEGTTFWISLPIKKSS